MTSGAPLDPLLAPLAAVQQLLERFANKGIIVGGVAASLLGTPRLTADVDVVLLLSTSRLPDLLRSASEVGLVPRLATAEAFARQHRVLLLRHDDSGINVDVILGMLPFEDEAVARATIHHVANLELRLPTPEDLIVFKAVAHRAKDLSDIQGIVQSHPNLDRQRIEHWVRAFAQALETPELWDDVAQLLASGE